MMIVTSTEYFRIHSQTISMFLFLQKYFTEDVDTGNYLCLVCYCWCWHVCPDSVLQTNWLSERCCSAVHCTVVYSVQCVTGGVSSAGGQYSGHRGHLSTSSCDQWERSEWSHRALLLSTRSHLNTETIHDVTGGLILSTQPPPSSPGLESSAQCDTSLLAAKWDWFN